MYVQPYVNGTVDTKRLVSNVKAAYGFAEFGNRGCGRSFTIIMHMLGQILGGPQNVLYLHLGVHHDECMRMMFSLHDVLIFKKIQFVMDKSTKKIFIPATHQNFFFTPIEKWWQSRRGYRAEIVYLDIAHIQRPVDQYDLDMIEHTAKEIYYG